MDDHEKALRLVADGVDAMSKQVSRCLPTFGYRVPLPRSEYVRVMATVRALYDDVICRFYPEGDE